MSELALEVGLPRGVEAPSLARGQLRDWFGFSLSEDTLDVARLLVSELVTNALLHGRGQIRLRAAVLDDHVLVEVFDDGDGFAWTRSPRGDESGVGGWGLRIVKSTATRCGGSRDPTHVWFELER